MFWTVERVASEAFAYDAWERQRNRNQNGQAQAGEPELRLVFVVTNAENRIIITTRKRERARNVYEMRGSREPVEFWWEYADRQRERVLYRGGIYEPPQTTQSGLKGLPD